MFVLAVFVVDFVDFVGFVVMFDILWCASLLRTHSSGGVQLRAMALPSTSSARDLSISITPVVKAASKMELGPVQQHRETKKQGGGARRTLIAAWALVLVAGRSGWWWALVGSTLATRSGRRIGNGRTLRNGR
jgi:hypothetical protein